MDADNTFIALYRKSLTSRVFRNEGLWKVWTWCLLKASYKERWISIKTGKSEIEVKVLPGQFVYGRLKAAKELNMKPSSVRNRMEKLKKMQNVDIKEDSQYSIISIINWVAYQEENKKEDSKEDNQRTIKGQSKDTNNKVNNVNTDNNVKILPQKEDFAEHYLTKKNRKLSGKRLISFNLFWDAFNYKKDKSNAADAWMDIKVLNNELVEKICLSAEKENINRKVVLEKKGTPIFAQGWINSRRWEDEVLINNKQESLSDYVKRTRK